MGIPLKSFNHCYRVLGPRSLGIFAAALLTGKPKLVNVVPEGMMEPVRLRVGTTDVATYKQIFLKQEYAWQLGNEPKCIIDAGANIGLTSVFFANRYPQAQILSLEPEPGNYQLLCQNVKPYPNIIPIHAALWNQDTEIELVDPGLGEWGFQTRSKLPADGQSSAGKVDAVTVDFLIEEYGLDSVDLLKVDIEGAEVEVFADAGSWIDRVQVIMTELHERFRPGCEAIFQRATAGFDCSEVRGPIAFVSR